MITAINARGGPRTAVRAEVRLRLVKPVRDTLEQMFECVSTIP